jgi:hypothetical protein
MLIKVPGLQTHRAPIEADDLIRRREGPGALEIYKKQMRDRGKYWRELQRGKRVPDSGVARKCMEIPVTLFAHTDHNDPEKFDRVVCNFWHSFPELRHRDGGCPVCGR